VEGKIIAIIHIIRLFVYSFIRLLVCLLGTAWLLFPIYSMLNNMVPKRRRMITLIPFIGFLRTLYTIEGQKYYDRAMKGGLIAICGLAGILVTLNL
jgi:hypothetical protein